MADEDQYCDDSLAEYINDPVVLKYDTPHAAAGEAVKRGEVKVAIFYDVFENQARMVMAAEGSGKRIATLLRGADEGIEKLGVEIRTAEMCYPARKVEPLASSSEAILSRAELDGKVDREAVHTLASKQLWAAQVALDINPLLASAFAIARAPGRARQLAPNQTFMDDQAQINRILRSHPKLPLVPRSTFPALDAFESAIAFQDASTSWGAQGWALVRGTLGHAPQRPYSMDELGERFDCGGNVVDLARRRMDHARGDGHRACARQPGRAVPHNLHRQRGSKGDVQQAERVVTSNANNSPRHGECQGQGEDADASIQGDDS